MHDRFVIPRSLLADRGRFSAISACPVEFLPREIARGHFTRACPVECPMSSYFTGAEGLFNWGSSSGPASEA